jgi:pimeloyl-ACP methyl ester carboxylesterase
MGASSTADYPPPGQLVPVDGRSIHLYATGDGAPTVVLEAGGESWSLDWHFVQQEVSTFARACSYDRAGFGWSDPGPKPRHAQAIADELSAVLQASQQRGPYVLVGASFGGHIVRLFAARHPDETAAVVLVDARHEQVTSRMPRSWAQLERAGAARQQVMLLLSRLRLLKWMAKIGGEQAMPPALKRLPAEMHPAYLAVGYQPKYFQANLAEFEAIRQSDAQVKDAGRLGSVPLVVVRHGIPSLFAAMPQADAVEAEGVWQGLQAELASLSSHSRLMVAEQSGHMIQLDQPSIVVQAIREIVNTVREAG